MFKKLQTSDLDTRFVVVSNISSKLIRQRCLQLGIEQVFDKTKAFDLLEQWLAKTLSPKQSKQTDRAKQCRNS